MDLLAAMKVSHQPSWGCCLNSRPWRFVNSTVALCIEFQPAAVKTAIRPVCLCALANSFHLLPRGRLAVRAAAMYGATRDERGAHHLKEGLRGQGVRPCYTVPSAPINSLLNALPKRGFSQSATTNYKHPKAPFRFDF